MAETTTIAWTQHTWNPWRGCTKVSPGCAHCYMFTAQERYGRDPSQVVRTKTWHDPIKWQKTAALAGLTEMVFTCSWSDWFHETADPWRNEAWDVIRRCPNLIFQILTKRPERIHGHLPIDLPRNGYPNVWLGVSVEDQKRADQRIPLLLDAPEAVVKFLSCEPLLGPLDLTAFFGGEHMTLDGSAENYNFGIDWLIAGGESGPHARPCAVAWIRALVEQCKVAGLRCFVKQLGSHVIDTEYTTTASSTRGQVIGVKLRDPKGGDPEEWSEDLRVREFPT